MANFVEVDDGVFVNLEKVINIDFIKTKKNTYRCRFYVQYLPEDEIYIKSKEFDSIDDLVNWIYSVINSNN